MFLRKGVPKICSKFTGKHPYRNVISKKLQSNFIEITLRHGCSPVNLLHISRTSFYKNTSGGLFLNRIIITINLKFFFSEFLTAGEGEGHFVISSYHFHLLHRHLDIRPGDYC